MFFHKIIENGPVIIEPKVFRDNRGYFFESFNQKEFEANVGKVDFVQDNESKSEYGVIRGLHFQTGEHEQAKLVRVVNGAVFDIAVDIRKDSPTFGKWFGVYLSERNHRQFFIPRGFAHGFVALEDDTVFQYKCDNLYCKESECAITWNDENIAIPWLQWVSAVDIKISEKDSKNKTLKEVFNVGQGQEDSNPQC